MLETIKKISSEKVKSYGAQYDAFWIFMVVFYLTPPITWTYWNPGPYPQFWILALRVFSFFLGGIIAIHRLWPVKIKPYLPIFWHFTLFFWCGFRTIFILLYSQHSKGFSVYGFIGIFLLAVLVDEITYTVILILSIIITPIFYYSTGGLETNFPPTSLFIQAFWMIGTISFFKWVFFRQQNNQSKEKIRCYQKIANIVAHEVRVPLAGIFIASKGQNAEIIKNNINGIKNIQLHIQKLSSQALTIVDMLIFPLRKNSCIIKNSKCSLNKCTEEALKEYPFEEGEKEKIYFIKDEDIEFYGNHRLIVHVIFNLIKNALYAIAESGKGHIYISIERQKNKLFFKDTATGICEKEAKKLFNEFYTTKPNGTGMGLSFCQEILSSIGGDIICVSKKEYFTEFQITFPELKRK